MSKVYDVIILGAGPAGLSAGIYAGRGSLSCLIIEKGQDGGQIALTGDIENYPGGMAEGEPGADLIARMSKQAEKFGAERVSDEVISADLLDDTKIINCTGGQYLGKTVIIAGGAFPRAIGCKNEEKFIGQGVSYCATCDAFFFRGKRVYVVGGGDSAIQEALHLTKFARSVTIIHRRHELRASQALQDQARANEKISFMLGYTVEELGGDDVLESMLVKNAQTGEVSEIKADPEDGFFGLFVFIGYDPGSGIFGSSLEMRDGYIITDEQMRTSIPGVFAAGDIRSKTLRQAITAASDGAIAAVEAYNYLHG